MSEPVWVYHFEYYDRVERRFVRSPRQALLRTIEAVNGLALMGTATLVEADKLDASGYVVVATPTIP